MISLHLQGGCRGRRRWGKGEEVCLYLVVNRPGWINNRHCHNALWDYANKNGEREIYMPLAKELEQQMSRVRAHLRSAAV